MTRWLAPLALVALVAAACGGVDEAAAPTTSTPPSAVSTTSGATSTTAPDDVTLQTCRADEPGYEVDYPSGWFVNGGDVADECEFFHPEPFELPADTEATGIAIHVSVNDRPFEEIAPTGDTEASEIVDRREATVANVYALRTETRATGGALLPDGTMGVTWYVDLGDETMVASTLDVATAGAFETNTEVLDGMMESLRLV